jgi:hypothetical protein
MLDRDAVLYLSSVIVRLCPMFMKLTQIGLVMFMCPVYEFVRMIQLNRWTDLDEIRYGLGRYHKIVHCFLTTVNTNVTDEQTSEVGSTLAPLAI